MSSPNPIFLNFLLLLQILYTLIGIAPQWFTHRCIQLKRSTIIFCYSLASAVTFTIIYPISCFNFLQLHNNSWMLHDVTYHVTFLLNWVITIFIFYHQIGSNRKINNAFMAFINLLLTPKSIIRDVVGQTKLKHLCQLSVISLSTLIMNFIRFYYQINGLTDYVNWILWIYLFWPNLLMTMLMNRFYSGVLLACMTMERLNETLTEIAEFCNNDYLGSCRKGLFANWTQNTIRERIDLLTVQHSQIHKHTIELVKAFSFTVLLVIAYNFFGLTVEVSEF
jgi:hypothetical protein